MLTKTHDAPVRARERRPAAGELPGAGLRRPGAPAPKGPALVTAIYLVAAAACLAVVIVAAIGLAF